jgi:hypothetical protein
MLKESNPIEINKTVILKAQHQHNALEAMLVQNRLFCCEIARSLEERMQPFASSLLM